LNDRVPYWLRTLLKYCPPPASVLELGSAHGGFVAFLRRAGYNAIGLELSPWLVEFAKETFDVTLLQGPLEDQQIAPGSLDVIAHMDVLEHLPDPLVTMQRALEFLKPGGVMLLQTPRFEPDKTYEQLIAQNHPFITHFKELEHLYLFSNESLKKFFARLGCDYVQFEPAIFKHYDMFALVSREPICEISQEQQDAALQATPDGRVMLALLEQYTKSEYLQYHADARLKVIEEQQQYITYLENVQKAAQEK
jgi:SAM-dependent methyltransferase